MNNDNKESSSLKYGEPFKVSLGIASKTDLRDVSVGVRIETASEVYISNSFSENDDVLYIINKSDKNSFEVIFNDFRLKPGNYKVTISLKKNNVFLDEVNQALSFTVEDISYIVNKPYKKTWGILNYSPKWS